MRIGIIRTAGSPCRCAEAVVKGLESLGHDFLLADSEEIELRASEIAHLCDLVIDHTDTFRGRGLFRPIVRYLLETHGARIAGSDSRPASFQTTKLPQSQSWQKQEFPPLPELSFIRNP